MRSKLLDNHRYFRQTIFINLFLWLSLVIITLPAVAIGLYISPPTLHITEKSPVAVLNIANTADSDNTTLLQLSAVKLVSKAKHSYAKTTDLLIYPPTISLTPKTKKIVRITLQHKPELDNQEYLLYLQEIPAAKSAKQATKQTAINTIVKISVPVFVTKDKS